MPIFAERMLAIQLLYDKIKNNGYLLWIAQKEGSYKQIREEGQNFFGDGIWMGTNRKYKTFYTYHRVDYLDEIMALCGFEYIKRFGDGDDARLYKKTKYHLFSNVITPEKIRKHIPIDKSIKEPQSTTFEIVKRNDKIKPIIPNPKPLTIESMYIDRIKSIKKGITDAESYHRIASYAIARIFRGSLRNMEIKVSVNQGIKIIDTVYTNCAEKGFFNNLPKQIDCKYLIVEVKNTKGDPDNSEIDQLNGRLSKERGNFGILICRETEDEDRVFARCQTHLSDSYIIFLTDEDIFNLLEYSREKSYDEINDLMDNKLRKLIFRP